MTLDSHDHNTDRPLVPAAQPEGYPAGYPAGQTPGAPLAGPVAPRTNTLSIVSLVTGFFCSIAAVITGHLALGQIKRSGEAGKSLAIAGLILGYLGIAATAVGVLLIVLFAATLGAFFSSVSGTTSSVIAGSGQVGAAHLDDGYLEVGKGSILVDLYVDPMCPYCGQFEIANGDTLAALVDTDSITLRLHSLTFLDQASQGTAYSSRASAALTCEAAINPDSTLDYLAALYANQPAEGTSGLTDDELVALSSGDDSIADCVTDGEYVAWSQQNTDDALTGPIEGADISSIQGTPTVLVDGSQYLGPIDDPQALTEFIVGAAS
ncbi:DUF4190 domain-containing protein [Cryobacterium sp. SO2]|uniref:DUF4190 domain-containing protein n=1 Tax=Cryobacterium sp. SO2 TaxID=1897060 RepID=UPI00223DFF5A|nr:DUF4190 domain-containing protein [Cryobacterium sp. SO2]WEO75692.1 DUF4190 domain-containing protein [Cryobacterium sp. SO2]